jgi:hypothetical protein
VDQAGNVVLQNAAPGIVGNLATDLNQIKGPSQLSFDLSLSKRIAVRESMYFTLRADALNILNRPIWGDPNTNINSASFGRITTAGGTRTVTLNVRFDF